MGCASSIAIKPSTTGKKSQIGTTKNGSSSIKSNKLPPIVSSQRRQQQQEKSLKQKQKRTINLEPFSLVWLDNGTDNDDKDLRNVIDYVRCFDNLNQCEEFLADDTNKNSHIFFVVSSQYATNIISHVHDLPQIIAIYVLQEAKSTGGRKETIDNQWTKRYSKVKGVFLNRQIVLDQLWSDVKIHSRLGDLLPITVYNRLDTIQTVSSSSTDHLLFLFYQVFIQHSCLTSTSSSSLDKTDLVELARVYYRANRQELSLVDEFDDDYTPSTNAIWWFTRESFLRRMLTHALRTANAEVLFAMRFLIKDMHKVMLNAATSTGQGQYQNGNSRSTGGRSTSELVLYRGQTLANETFLKIKSNIGELVSINHFLLTNKTKQRSLTFIRQNISATNLLHRVLFEIKIPSGLSSSKQRPFVDISHLSYSMDKDVDPSSVLFFIGSIFRINSVSYDYENECWLIQLTLYDDRTNQDFSSLFTFLNNTNTSNNSITLANLLRQISPDLAEQFYQYILNENEENERSLLTAECYRGLGLCSYARDDYEQALSYFEKALEMRPNDRSIKSSLHNSVGLVYARQDDIDEALVHFNKALESCSLPLHVACAHHNLALAYGAQGQFDDELEHYRQALEIRTKQLPAHHLQVASLHNNIGTAYGDLEEYDRALSSLKQGLEMRLKLLPANHVDVARSYANIGTVYAKTREYRMALEYFAKARDLFEQQSQNIEQELEQLERNVKFVNDKLRRKTY